MPNTEKKKIKTFQKIILEWFTKNGRHDLPWRQTQNPYRILVSEVMLQQTQVDRVKEKYSVFLKHFSTPKKLAAASPAEVLTVWKGLGYNRRALYLKRAAEAIIRDHHGRFPRAVLDIEKLPGVGPYTARAVAVFAFNEPHVFIETNIRRVFIYFFGDVIPPEAIGGIQKKNNYGLDPALRRDDKGRENDISDKELLPIIEKALYKKNPRLWYNALMDYGALALGDIPNPNRRSRHYAKQSRFEGSRRYARASILHYLLKKKATVRELHRFFLSDPHLERYADTHSITDILTCLKKEGFLDVSHDRWSVSTK
ncbi:A/G-specific adenine glycosylase [Candidatus Uhrbacteria bacterium]|nr:A/G-specific adenine glycosylase [Candidatus Uhrbacteria bacterium]